MAIVIVTMWHHFLLVPIYIILELLYILNFTLFFFVAQTFIVFL